MNQSDREKVLGYSRWLLDHGAPASSAALLHAAEIYGAEAGQILRSGSSATLLAGTYALVVASLDVCEQARRIGVVARVPTRPGRWRPVEPEMSEGYDVMMALCRARLGADLPFVRFEFASMVDTAEGPSFGLPSLLATLAHYVPSRVSTRAVLATGRVTRSGEILPVGGMTLKLAAAAAEKGDKLVLVPPGTEVEGATCVATVDEAIRLVFGSEPLKLDEQVLGLGRALERSRHARDLATALGLLQIPEDNLRPPDLARLKFEQGAILLHLGQTDEAVRTHEQAVALLGADVKRLIGSERAEYFDLLPILAAMDRFELERAIDSLESLVSGPFLSPANEIRYRGALAQAYGMRGDYAEAVRTRSANLRLHAATEDLEASEPGTRCCLARDSAQAADRSGFEEHATRLGELRARSDDHQARFNASAIIRGLVVLGEYARALAFARGEEEAYVVRVPDSVRVLLHGTTSITTHPEASTARALTRALRKIGDIPGALRFADRADPEGDCTGPLVRWMCALIVLEGSLARAQPKQDEVQTKIRARMKEWHPAASAFHTAVMTASGVELEAALDRVWY
jgi:tetratricopeptide (TPR) repeat protein